MQQHSKRQGLLHNLCEKVLKRSLTLCTLFQAPLFTENCDDVGVMGQLVILNQCLLISVGKGDKKRSGELVHGDAGEICIFQTVDDEFAGCCVWLHRSRSSKCGGGSGASLGSGKGGRDRACLSICVVCRCSSRHT